MTATVSLIQLLKENVTKKLFTLVDNINTVTITLRIKDEHCRFRR